MIQKREKSAVAEVACGYAIAILVFLLGSCTGEESYRLRLVLPDQEARDSVSRIHLWALEPGGVRCDQLIAGETDPETVTVRERLVIEYPSDGEYRLALEHAGEVLFHAEGRTQAGAMILRGCKRARVGEGAESEVTITLAWICHPEDEITGNGEDDDCDGLTDECESDSDCDDDNGCTDDFCSSNQCLYTDSPSGSQCTDGDHCTTGDACDSGLCAGLPKDCGVYDGMCTLGVCDQDTGECGSALKQNGTVCDDGQYCTEGDACQDGVCTPTSLKDCDDGVGCTQDFCNNNDSRCDHVPEPSPGPEGPAGSSSCDNGLDDDCDGWTDGEDADCGYVYSVVKAALPPVIDGDCGEFIDAQSLTLRSEYDNFTVYWLMWDQTALYVCADVLDVSLDAAATDPVADRDGFLWNDDSLEIFFDVDDNGGSSLQQGDYKFFVNVANVQTDREDGDRTWDTSIDSQVTTRGTVNDDIDSDIGYTIELALPWGPWGVIPPDVNTVWGCDLMLDDRDDVAGTLRTYEVWANLDGDTVNNPDGWGDAVFVEK